MASTSKRIRIEDKELESKKSATKRKSNNPQKLTRENKIVPRLRLEPKFLPNPEESVASAKSKEFLPFEENKNETETSGPIPFKDGPIEEIEEQIVGDDTGRICEMLIEMSRMSPVASLNDTVGVVVKEDQEPKKRVKIQTPVKPKPLFSGHRLWKDKELMNLAVGLQSCGFADLDKVADIVKTKSEQDIRLFVKERIKEVNKRENPRQGRGRGGNAFFSLTPEYVSAWPTVRKWRRMACDQMLSCVRTREYSKLVMTSLFQKFYEEEEEPTDSNVINIKAVYKYLLDCMSGHIPAQLPPKESAIVMSLLSEVRSMVSTLDFSEELKFLKDYKGATKFRPIHVKDEFKKKYTKKTSDDTDDQAVSVAESVFMELSRHKRIVQSFNPVVTPVWLLHKEQEILGDYLKGDVKI